MHYKALIVTWVLIALFVIFWMLLFKSPILLKLFGMTDVSIAFRDAILPNYFVALPKKFIEDFIDDEKEFRNNGFNMLEDDCL